MTNLYNLNYFESENKEKLNIILNGLNDKSDSEFIKYLHSCCVEVNQSVISFDYEFQFLGYNKTSWPELEVEVDELDQIIKQYAWNYKKINFIAKSLWGIIVSKYLKYHAMESEFSVKILGYIHNEMEIETFISSVSIIQWEYDRFGSPTQIDQRIQEKYHQSVSIVVIWWADHSFRNTDKTWLLWLDLIGKSILE